MKSPTKIMTIYGSTSSNVVNKRRNPQTVPINHRSMLCGHILSCFELIVLEMMFRKRRERLGRDSFAGPREVRDRRVQNSRRAAGARRGSGFTVLRGCVILER